MTGAPASGRGRPRGSRRGILLFALALLAAAAPCPAAWEPPGWRSEAPAEPAAPTSPVRLVADWLLRGYQATVSRVDGDRCPSHPSCSAYARQAVARHGALLGAVLTAGRLLSEADEAAFAPRVRVGGRWKVHAPVADDLAFLRGPLAP